MANGNTVNVSHTEAAQALIEKIRALRDSVPNFTIPASKQDSQKMSAAASLPPDFVELTVTTTKNSADLTRGGATDPDQVRDLMSYAEAYAPVTAEVEAFLQFLKHSVRTAKNRAGRHALTTYSLTKRLAKAPETSYLAPAAEAMKEVLRKRAKKAKATTPAPTTPPTAPAA
jgi:hypothetical protein